MTFSNINVSNPNDGLGDKLRDAFVKVNDNFGLIGDIVTPDYLSATLSSYETIVDADNSHSNLQEQITNQGYLIDLGEGSIQSLQTEVNNLELLINGKASLTQLNEVNSSINSTISNLQTVVENKIDEAPLDGKTYGRKDGNWVEVVETTPAYQSYSALLTQNGEGEVGVSNYGVDNMIVGRTYRISKTDGDTCDFTNIGAPRNTLDTYFVATGINPTSWGENNAAELEFIVGAPVVSVLQNTIGDVVWIYDGKGYYNAVVLDDRNEPLPLFPDGKVPTLNYLHGPTEAYNSKTLIAGRSNDYYLSVQQYNRDFEREDNIANAYIEIRVYN